MDCQTVFNSVNYIYDRVVEGLRLITQKFIPRHRGNFYKFWWSVELDIGLLKDNIKQWNRAECETRRPASADRTARRQFQAIGQPVSRTQASDVMTSQLPRYEAKCVQHMCFQCGSVPCVQISRERSYPLPTY